MKKILIACVLALSISYATSITAKQTVVCCPTKDQTDEAYSLVGNKRALMRFMYKKGCTIASEGQTVERMSVSFTMVKIFSEDYGEFWCPREIAY